MDILDMILEYLKMVKKKENNMKKSELKKLIQECHKELLTEAIDAKYLQIKFNTIKTELDFIIKLYAQEETDKAREYLADQINNLKGILTRM